MIIGERWTTADPLGLGGLLIDAYRIRQLMQRGTPRDARLLDELLDAALMGLQRYVRSGELQQPAEYRLAFRELGLAIGLHAVQRMEQAMAHEPQHASLSTAARERIQALAEYAPILDEIERFWRNTVHQRTTSWTEHQDINEVMLATSLAPDGFLVLWSPN